MDNKFYQDDLEQFLQEEVKQHRMYPSDHIWKNIRTELHGYDAWPALTFISLFIITALTISTLLNNHPANYISRSNISAIAPKPLAVISPMSVSTERSNKNYFEKIAPQEITAETFASYPENMGTKEQLLTIETTYADQMLLTTPSTIAIEASTHTDKITPAQLLLSTPEEALVVLPHTTDFTTAKEEVLPPATTIAVDEPILNTTARELTVAQLKKNDAHATADDFLKDFSYTAHVTPRRNSKFGFQFYVTPSTSYRRLSDEKVKEIIQPAAAASVTQNAPLSLNYSTYSTNVNNVVRHRPAVGMEVGFSLLYNMGSKLKLKTGVQLNVRQYYIETFESLTNDLASLSLINYRGVETINFYSAYNNNTGYRQTELDNKVYQFSIPIGIQFELLQGKHFGISSEASVQPTLTLNNNTYLLSNDYKHYTDGNNFIRKWNINTSVGLNLSYKAGSSSWQLGPQIRYQHLPTYSNSYPIKEYLMDYGVRLGFTKQIR